MKMLKFLFPLPALLLCSLYAQSQVSIRKSSDAPAVDKENNTSLGLQTVQPASSTQTVQSASYQSTGIKTKYYSVDQTAFSCSWGEYEIRKMYLEGAYLYTTSTLGTAPYLVAPVNIPHNATIISMKVIFYDAFPPADLRAILWQGGPNFGGADSYNLAQIESNFNGGSVQQSKDLNARVDNENHSYYVTVGPTNNSPWPVTGELKIKRITIAYTETE